jgi:transketolase
MVPGTAAELSSLMLANYDNGKPNYYRLTENPNQTSINLQLGKSKVIKQGNSATILVIGPLLDLVLDTFMNRDVEIIYTNSVNPFDQETIRRTEHNYNLFYNTDRILSGLKEELINPILEFIQRK